MDHRTRTAVRYALSGGVHIAWQSVGDGERDVVFVPGWVSNVEANWEFPEIARFLERLTRLGRLIVFDKRGTGLSDAVARMPSMGERMDDIRAVLDAAQAGPAIVIGTSEGCALGSLFAATYPERCSALVLYGGYARRQRTADYPWAPTTEARRAFLADVLAQWGGPMDLSTLAPTRLDDADFCARFAAYLRSSASPAAAHALAHMNTFVDVGEALPRIAAPTLVLHRTGDRDVLVDEGRYVASRIPHAQFTELEGDDHWPFVGDADALLDAIEAFVRRLPATRPAEQESRRTPFTPHAPHAPHAPHTPPVPFASDDPIDALTPRQRDVLELIAQGHSNKRISSLLGASEHTVHRHVADLLGRLGVANRAAAAALFAHRFPR
ncbi:MAG: prkC 33 [Rhizobacter sp.]|nr:prkC 33 [Rhizobacter sp.]